MEQNLLEKLDLEQDSGQHVLEQTKTGQWTTATSPSLASGFHSRLNAVRWTSRVPFLSRLRTSDLRQLFMAIVLVNIVLISGAMVYRTHRSNYFKPNRIPKHFTAGQSHVLPLPSFNASIGVRLSHVPLNRESYVLTLLRATNHIVDSAKEAKKAGKDYEIGIKGGNLMWYESAPSAKPGEGVFVKLDIHSGANREEIQKVPGNGTREREDQERKTTNVMKLIVGILRALHEFRLNPQKADLVVKDEKGWVYGKGCLGLHNGTCS